MANTLWWPGESLLFSVLCKYKLIHSSWQPYEVATIIILILTDEHTEAESSRMYSKTIELIRGGVRILTQEVWLQSALTMLPLSCVDGSILLCTPGHVSGREVGPSLLDQALVLVSAQAMSCFPGWGLHLESWSQPSLRFTDTVSLPKRLPSEHRGETDLRHCFL